jgi:hypothetical protein
MNTVVYLLPDEAARLARLDQCDVIATGPWRKGETSLPHRAVIRDLGNTYVVHNQIIGDSEGGTAYYAQGTYVHKDDFADRLDVALVEFDKRIRRHHNLPVRTRQ